MNKLTAIILDDEASAQETLELMLNNFCPRIQVVGKATDIEQGIQLLDLHKPDILFLDIHLENELSIKSLTLIQREGLSIIFVTAYDKYAIEAINNSAFGYILKPIDPDQLIQITNKVVAKKRSEVQKRVEPNLNHILVPSKDLMIRIDFNEILRLESDNNYCWITKTNDERILVSKTLKSMEQSLPPNEFIRIHQKHLIRISSIYSISKGAKAIVKLTNGTELPVSRDKKTDLLNLFRL